VQKQKGICVSPSQTLLAQLGWLCLCATAADDGSEGIPVPVSLSQIAAADAGGAAADDHSGNGNDGESMTVAVNKQVVCNSKWNFLLNRL